MNELKVYPEQKQKYPYISDFVVLHSEAGWYIGKLYCEGGDECNPYSREIAEERLMNGEFFTQDDIL